MLSNNLNRFYVGTTDNVEKRFLDHNSGFYTSSFTAIGIPWELSLSYGCESSDKAYKLEQFIKRMKSKKFIERLIDDELIINDIV